MNSLRVIQFQDLSRQKPASRLSLAVELKFNQTASQITIIKALFSGYEKINERLFDSKVQSPYLTIALQSY